MVNSMTSIQNFNAKIRSFNRMDNQIISQGLLNNRVANKFNVLMRIFEDSLGASIEFISKGFCRGRFRTTDRNYDVEVVMKYELKNMLLGRNYDLTLKSDFNLQEANESIDDFSVVTSYSGKLKYNDVKFIVEYGDSSATDFVNIINNTLVKERIIRLQIINLRIGFSRETGNIEIVIESIKGSCTWSLIPPVLQLIKPKQRDCIDMVELIQLIIHGAKLSVEK